MVCKFLIKKEKGLSLNNNFFQEAATEYKTEAIMRLLSISLKRSMEGSIKHFNTKYSLVFGGLNCTPWNTDSSPDGKKK